MRCFQTFLAVALVIGCYSQVTVESVSGEDAVENKQIMIMIWASQKKEGGSLFLMITR